MKRSLAMAVFVLNVAGAGGPPASAGEGEPTADGRRVRISAPGFAKKPIIGTLIAIDGTRVTVQRAKESERVAIPRDAVARFEISRKNSRKGTGAGIGALTGAGFGAAIGFAAGEECGAPDASSTGLWPSRRLSILCFSRGESAAGVGLAGAVLGAIVGAIVAPGEKWETANPDSLKVSVTPLPGGRGGVGLMLSLSF